MTPYYRDAFVTLYLGDAREVVPQLADAFDVIVSDPPYGISWDTRQHGASAARSFGVRRQLGLEHPPIVGDGEPFDPAWLLELGRPMALFGANHYADRLPASAGWVVWDKRVDGPSLTLSDCELVWTNVSGSARMIRHAYTGGLSIAKETGRRVGIGRPVGLHPTQKPVTVMRQLLARMPAGVVLDPYAGVGSTLVAAKLDGRASIGVEIHEPYLEAAATRCAQGTLEL